jgi:hypothetical protein
MVTCSTTIPFDNSIPQNTEGTEVLTVTITPQSTSNILVVSFASMVGNGSASTQVTAALFRDSVVDALAAQAGGVVTGTSTNVVPISFTYYLTAPSTSSQTYKIRVGNSAGTVYVNGDTSGVQLYGGVAATTLIVTEIAP